MTDRSTDGRADDPMTLSDLPHGKGLKAVETAAITRRALTSVVLFAGTADCGKTTLLATLHFLFQAGPFAGYNFAGSDTLVGFEDRVSLARTASGRSAATTPRTTISEYLHLRVRREDSSQPIRDLLLCDLWGDDFREAKDNVEACRELSIISTADAYDEEMGRFGAKGACLQVRSAHALSPAASASMSGWRSPSDFVISDDTSPLK